MDNIDELNHLIESLEADSPLRESLKKALSEELERLAEVAEAKAGEWQEKAQAALENALRAEEPVSREEDNAKDKTAGQPEKSTVAGNQADESQGRAQAATEKRQVNDEPAGQAGLLGGFTDKLDELLEDDEFITASAGFLLGAATVGMAALAISLLKK